MDQCVVDMNNHTCSYWKWELTGIPYKHALVEILYMIKDKINISLPQSWVHPTYWLSTWKEMYSFKIEAINGITMWVKYPCPTTSLLPKHHVPIGRPKKKRRKYVVEWDEVVKGGRALRKEKYLTCSKCKNISPNKRSCKGEVDEKKGKKHGGGNGAGPSKKSGAWRKGKKNGGGNGSGPSKQGGARKKGKKVV